MCEMLNVFIPATRPILPPPVRGLSFVSEGEIQKDFAARHERTAGVLLAGVGGGPCLCGFDDWDALYAIAREVLAKNRLEWMTALHFWSGDRYALEERRVDPDDPETCTPCKMGEVALIHAEPAERRRHRLVVRELSRAVDHVVTVRLKSGQKIRALLASFDAESEVGRLGMRTFVAAEVLSVEHAG